MLSGSTLYGTTFSGGSPNRGTIFKLSTNGTGYAFLKDFNGSDGENPRGTLVLSGNTLYGNTQIGGTSNLGTVFKLNTNGTGFTALKEFTGNDGATPVTSLVVSGSTLYGTTYAGGSSNVGTVFKLNTDGSGFAVIKQFAGSDGANPVGGLVMSGTMLYGTTYIGGSFSNGVVFSINLSPIVMLTNAGDSLLLTWTAISGLTLLASQMARDAASISSTAGAFQPLGRWGLRMPAETRLGRAGRNSALPLATSNSSASPTCKPSVPASKGRGFRLPFRTPQHTGHPHPVLVLVNLGNPWSARQERGRFQGQR